MSDVPREFVFTRFPARQGTVWLRSAYLMFRQHPAPWAMLVLAYVAAIVAVSAIPVAGPYVAGVLRPVLAVGLLAAAWKQERGGAPELPQLFQGFRSNVVSLVCIGIFTVVGIWLSVRASALVDGGRLLELRGAAGTLTEEELGAGLREVRVQLGMVLSTILSTLVVVAAWWAPALVVFQDARADNALVTSLRAALANWKALAIYGLTVFFYGIVVTVFAIALLALFVPAPAFQTVALVVLLPYMLVFVATLHVSDYVSYREVFHANETLAPLSRSAAP
jgi:uncharacterized membrane protein